MCSDPKVIVGNYGDGKGFIVVFSTYQSIEAIEQTQALTPGLPRFDLVVCDEAPEQRA